MLTVPQQRQQNGDSCGDGGDGGDGGDCGSRQAVSWSAAACWRRAEAHLALNIAAAAAVATAVARSAAAAANAPTAQETGINTDDDRVGGESSSCEMKHLSVSSRSQQNPKNTGYH